jgi:hypothetical protein
MIKDGKKNAESEEKSTKEKAHSQVSPIHVKKILEGR